MSIQNIVAVITAGLVMGAGIVFWSGVRPIIAALKHARPSYRFNDWTRRLNGMFVHVFGHRRLLRNRLAGVAHLLIFASFLVLMLDVVETLGQLVTPAFSLGTVADAAIDVFVLLCLAGVALAIYQRQVIRPRRFDGSDPRDASVILALITVIVLGIVVHDSFFEILYPHRGDGHFLAFSLSRLWIALGGPHFRLAPLGYVIGYLMDIGVLLGFLAYLPRSKHFHVLTGIPTVFFRNLDDNGTLVPQEPAAAFAIQTPGDFTWKDILDFFSCTECGRCQEVCPAYLSGLPLSPKEVILTLRDAFRTDRFPIARPLPLAGGIISRETLWACTTCGACQEACPLFIEHVPKIVGLRAALVEEGDLDDRIKHTLENVIEEGNVYGKNPLARPSWQKQVSFRFKDARLEPVEWLWYLGDVTSYDTDERVAASVQATGDILAAAGLNVGLLFDGERSSGNDVLRLGEYGLFETLVKENLVVMNNASFDKVFTSDPHSFHALQNDYRRFGFQKPVFHYSQLLLDLLEGGFVHVKYPLNIPVTYHDPCYLGRWNGIFDAPRKVLDLCHAEVTEMPRNRERSFCCGAGGGRMWMSDANVSERPSENRIREALALPDVQYFVVACPKDMVMYAAAVAAIGVQDRLKVIDLAEIVSAAIGTKELQRVWSPVTT